MSNPLPGAGRAAPRGAAAARIPRAFPKERATATFRLPRSGKRNSGLARPPPASPRAGGIAHGLSRTVPGPGPGLRRSGHGWPAKPQPALGAPGAPAGRDQPQSRGFSPSPQPGRSTGARGAARGGQRSGPGAAPAEQQSPPGAPLCPARRTARLRAALTVPGRARQPSWPLRSSPLTRARPPSAGLVPSRPVPTRVSSSPSP